MAQEIKNIANRYVFSGVFIFCLLLPFLFLSDDIYPFFRMSFYAKSLKNMPSVDKFEIKFVFRDGHSLGYPGFLTQDIMRQHFYRHDTHTFLVTLYQALKMKNSNLPKSIRFNKIKITSGQEKPDTLTIDSLIIQNAN